MEWPWRKLATFYIVPSLDILATIEALHHSNIIGIAQFPGVVIAWEIAYGGSNFEVEAVMVLVNAMCYSALFAGLLLLVRTARKALVHE